MRRILALTPAVFRTVAVKERLVRLLEQAVLAACLIFALSPFIDTGAIAYPAFLLCGLAPWFYFREILLDMPEICRVFGVLTGDRAAALLPSAQAIAALPTLIIWMAAAVAAHLLHGGAPMILWLMPVFVLCNFLNAAAQATFLAALAPVLGASGSGLGLELTLPFLFWTTPIAWPLLNPAGIMRILMGLNPLYVLAEGLRAALAPAHAGTSSGALPAALFFAMVLGAWGIGRLLDYRRRLAGVF